MKFSYLAVEGLDLPNATIDSIGNSILGPITDIAKVVGLVAAVGAIMIVAITLIMSKRQEERTEAMSRVITIGGAIALIGLATSLIGFFSSTFIK